LGRLDLGGMKLSEAIMAKAIRSTSDELAWKKEDVFHAIGELIDNKSAILGGEVWFVERNHQDIQGLAHLDNGDLAIGFANDKDGNELFGAWSSDKELNESWEAFVLRSKTEAVQAINKMDIEEIVEERYRNSVYYNLIFADEAVFLTLRQQKPPSVTS
jgi:hypothetical protein